jgi:hypothetical protein
MAANTNIQVTNLDFDSIKNGFVNFLQGQSTFQDYNFEGSGLNTLLDVLAYNTQYNAYYLNMVANEMFLDSAIQRSSVVSHAKLLGYVPTSATCPQAQVNVIVNNVNASSLTLPAYSNFLSAAVNGVNYNFVNPTSYTVNTVNNTATFNNVIIEQGVPATVSFTVSSATNPTYTFEIPDSTIDTSTLQVVVQASSSNVSYSIYNLATDYLTLDGTSQVYFLQESLNGNYQITFGDGAIGQQLNDGNIVTVNYLSTEGTSAAGSNSFTLMNTVGGYSPSAVNSVIQASSGANKESITSIKYQAPKAFAAQGRAVTVNDYITAIKQNNLGIAFDAVSVWNGAENNPPVYGQIFVAVKPTGYYTLTTAQKQALISQVINPISVLTVTPTIVDPDYIYVNLSVNVYYNPNLTTLTSEQIQTATTTAIQNFASSTLNTFNSVFNSYNLTTSIQNADQSIITSEFKLQIQKKFFPLLNQSSAYTLYFGNSLQKGILLSGISSYPGMTFNDPNNLANQISEVYIEEVPVNEYGINSILIANPGFGYQYTPTVTINGDGSGATAEAIIAGGSLQSIMVTNSGNNYTSAAVTITPNPLDTTGTNGAATASLQGGTGTLRLYYYDSLGVKNILNSNIGTVDYVNGIISLTNFNPVSINNTLGQLAITATPTIETISSSYNRILTLDTLDSTAITVNVISHPS